MLRVSAGYTFVALHCALKYYINIIKEFKNEKFGIFLEVELCAITHYHLQW